MDERSFQKILRRYINGKASDAEKRMIDVWYEKMGNADPSVLHSADDRALQDRYWSIISEHIRPTTKIGYQSVASNRPRARTVVWYALSAAASLAFLILGYSVFYSTKQSDIKPAVENVQATIVWTTLENKTAVAKEFNLPDQSNIKLEPHSQLRYQSVFNQTKREVFLEGEAHFNVAHDEDRPFLVHAREVTTSVLGTSFTVKAFENDKHIRVAVLTGRVAVSADQADANKNAKAEIILTPNQQIVYNRDEKSMARSIVEEPRPIPAVEEIRRKRFEEAPVSEIFMALEKVYGVKIRFDKNRFSSCVLTTSISDGGIYNRLDIICQAIGAQYQIEEDQITITGTGCD